MKLGTPFWHCKYLYTDKETGVKVYAKPVEYITRANIITINSTNSYLDTVRYGDKVDRMWSLLADERMFKGVFGEHDLFYVDGNKPNIEDENYENGYGANAVAQPPRTQYRKIKVMLEQDGLYQN